MTDLRQAAQQEPVAWAVVGEGKFGPYEIGRETETISSACKYWANRGYSLVPLYTTPPQRPWVGLTDEETQAYWDWEDWQTGAGRSTIFEMVKDIEAKLKEKNG